MHERIPKHLFTLHAVHRISQVVEKLNRFVFYARFFLPLHQLLSTYVATMYSLQQSDRTLAETSESYSN